MAFLSCVKEVGGRCCYRLIKSPSAQRKAEVKVTTEKRGNNNFYSNKNVLELRDEDELSLSARLSMPSPSQSLRPSMSI